MIIIDVETSGLQPDVNSLLSIGAVEWDNPGNQFYGECRPWEGAEVTDKALEVNGFTRDYIDQLDKTPGELIVEFDNWAREIEDRTYCGYNVQFDHGFLKAQYKRSGLPWPFGFRWVDAHSVVYFGMEPDLRPLYRNNSSLSLDRALETYFLEPESKPHNAMNGAMKVYELLQKVRSG